MSCRTQDVQDNRAVQRALFSVYYHKYFAADARPVGQEDWEKVRPISLSEAESILRKAVDRSQSLACKLLAGLRLHDAHVLHPGFIGPPPALEIASAAALKLYGVTLVPPQSAVALVTRQSLRDIPTYTDPSQIPDDPLGELPVIDPGFRVKEDDISNGYYYLRNYVCDITSHGAKNSVSAVWSIDVRRSFDTMLPVLDARNWDHCSAYVEVAAELGGLASCPSPDPGPPPDSGSDWSGLLCETIGTGLLVPAAVSNRLYFTFTVADELALTTFSDKDPAGKDTGVDPVIEYDRGWLAAGSLPGDPGWTRIRGFKHLRFTFPYLRTVAVPMMEAWIREEVLSGTACALELS